MPRGPRRPIPTCAAAVGAGLVAAAAAAVIAAARAAGPRPGARVVRWLFERGGVQTNRVLAAWEPAPDAVTTVADLRYRPGDPDGRLDVHVPTAGHVPLVPPGTGERLPTVVWVHGGGWLAGRKEHTAPWARILAARGYAVVVPDYTLAPGAHYPHQLQQVLDALAWLHHDAPAHVDPDRLVVAGDSAGASLAAQAVTALRYPGYAAAAGVQVDPALADAVPGLVLASGIFDLSLVGGGDGKDAPAGIGGWLMRTIGWAYGGRRDFLDDPRAATLSLVDQVHGPLPPTFVTGGNGDALTAGSRVYAERLAAAGTPVETLFFPDDYRDPSSGKALPHEYQFDLRLDAARVAFDRLVAFLGERGTAE